MSCTFSFTRVQALKTNSKMTGLYSEYHEDEEDHDLTIPAVSLDRRAGIENEDEEILQS